MEPRVNKILKKLSNEKIKLATQKVDLGSIEDLEKYQFDLDFFIKNVKPEMANADKLLTEQDKLTSKISDLLKDMLSLEKVGQKSIDNALKTYDKVEKQIKELGITKNNVPMMGQLMKSIDKATNDINDLNQLYDYLQSTT